MLGLMTDFSMSYRARDGWAELEIPRSQGASEEVMQAIANGDVKSISDALFEDGVEIQDARGNPFSGPAEFGYLCEWRQSVGQVGRVWMRLQAGTTVNVDYVAGEDEG